MKLYGGAAIGSGTFGCAFHPSLHTVEQLKSDDTVSKLMTRGDAENESRRLGEVLAALQQLPVDVQPFFLVPNPTVLRVKEFVDEDFKEQAAKCQTFFKNKGINIQKLQRNDPATLQQLGVINSRYGGQSVDDIIDAEQRRKHIDARVYTQMLYKYIEFLQVGVGALVDNNVVHGDIKVQNMVWNQAAQLRLIDWGSFNEEREVWHWNFPPQALLQGTVNIQRLTHILANLNDASEQTKRRQCQAAATILLGRCLRRQLEQQRAKHKGDKLNTLGWFGHVLRALSQVCSEDKRKQLNKNTDAFWTTFPDLKTYFREDVTELLDTLTDLKQQFKHNATAVYVLVRSLYFCLLRVVTINNNRLVFQAQQAKAEVKKYFDTYSTLLALAEVVATPLDNLDFPVQGGQSDTEEERAAKRARTASPASPVNLAAYGIPSESAQWRVGGDGSTLYNAVALGSGTTLDDLGARMAGTWGKQKVEQRYELFGQSSTETQQWLLLYGDRPETWTTGDPQDVHMRLLAKALQRRIAVFHATNVPDDLMTRVWRVSEFVKTLNVQPEQVRVGNTKGPWLYLVEHDKQFWALIPDGDDWKAPVSATTPPAPAAAAPAPQPPTAPPAQTFEFHYANGDGGCFYYAVEMALQRTREAYTVYGSQKAEDKPRQEQLLSEYGQLLELTYRSLPHRQRADILELIKQQSTDVARGSSPVGREDALHLLQNLHDPSAWVRGYASLYQLQLLSLALKVPFGVYGVDKSEYKRLKRMKTFTHRDLLSKGGAGGTSYYHLFFDYFGEPQVYLLFSGGNHYDALIPQGVPQADIDFLRTLRQEQTRELLDALGPARAPPAPPAPPVAPVPPAPVPPALVTPVPAPVLSPPTAPPAPVPALTKAQMEKVKEALADRLLTLLMDSAFNITPESAAESLQHTLDNALETSAPAEPGSKRRKKGGEEEQGEVFLVPPQKPVQPSDIQLTFAPPQAKPRPEYMILSDSDRGEAADVLFGSPGFPPDIKQKARRDEDVCGTLWYPEPLERLTFKNFEFLLDETWVNDAIIRVYLRMIKAVSERKCVLFDSLLISNQRASPLQDYYALVNSTVDKQEIDLTGTPVIIFPINVLDDKAVEKEPQSSEGKHWYFVYVDLEAQQWLICDSLSKGNVEAYNDDLDVVQKTLDLIPVAADKKQVLQWQERTSIASFPQQRNGYDCAIFMCMGIECVTQSREFDFNKLVTHADAGMQAHNLSHYLRSLMVAQILRGDLRRIPCVESVQLEKRKEEQQRLQALSKAQKEAAQEARKRRRGEQEALSPSQQVQVAEESGDQEAMFILSQPSDEQAGPMVIFSPQSEFHPLWGVAEPPEEQFELQPPPPPAPLPDYMTLTSQDNTLNEMVKTLNDYLRGKVVEEAGKSLDALRRQTEKARQKAQDEPTEENQQALATLQQQYNAKQQIERLKAQRRRDKPVKWVRNEFGDAVNLTYGDLDDLYNATAPVSQNAMVLYMYLLQQRSTWEENVDQRSKTTVILNTLDMEAGVPVKNYWIQNLGVEKDQQKDIPTDTTVLVALQKREIGVYYAVLFDRSSGNNMIYVLDALPQDVGAYNIAALAAELHPGAGAEWGGAPQLVTQLPPDVQTLDDVAVYMCMAVEQFTRGVQLDPTVVLNMQNSIKTFRRIMAAHLYVGELDTWKRRKERMEKTVRKLDAPTLWLAIEQFKQQKGNLMLQRQLDRTRQEIAEVTAELATLGATALTEDECKRLRCAALEYARRKYCEYDLKSDEAQRRIYTLTSKPVLAAAVKPKELCAPFTTEYFGDKQQEWEALVQAAGAAGAAEAAEAAEPSGELDWSLLDSPYIPVEGGGISEEKKAELKEQKALKKYYEEQRDEVEAKYLTYNQILREQGCVLEPESKSKKRAVSGEEKDEPDKIWYKREIPKQYSSWKTPLERCAQEALQQLQQQQTRPPGRKATQREIEQLQKKLDRLQSKHLKEHITWTSRQEVKQIYEKALAKKRAKMPRVDFVKSVISQIQQLDKPIFETLEVAVAKGSTQVQVNDTNKFPVNSTIQIGDEQRTVTSIINGNTLIVPTRFRNTYQAGEQIEVFKKGTLTIWKVLPSFVELLSTLNTQELATLMEEETDKVHSRLEQRVDESEAERDKRLETDYVFFNLQQITQKIYEQLPVQPPQLVQVQPGEFTSLLMQSTGYAPLGQG